jgi:S-adenosylmethionine uptake transporter
MTAPTTDVQAGASAPVLRWAAAPIWAALLAAAAFIGMDAAVKGMTPRYGAVQLTFFRFASGLVFAVGLWAWWRTPMPSPGQWRMHLLRSALLLVTLGLYFHALSVLALAQTVAMGYTAPIFISLLAMLLLRERPSRWIWGALALGFLGAGVALWPELQRGRPQLSGLLFAAGSAVCFAFVMVLTRRQAQHDALPTFMLMQNLLPVLMLAVPVAVVWRPVPASDLPAIAAVGALATVGLSAIAWALRHMEASRLAPVEYTGFVWAALVGYVAFGEVPTVYTAGSALLIVAGCLLLLRR